jgi:hypothetical protein
MTEIPFEHQVQIVLKGIENLLLEKRKAYGDSALNPIRIFSKANADEALLARIDDKLSRIKNLGFEDNEDSINDLIGYLVLLKISLSN